VGLTGGDANLTVGYSRFELRFDLGYERGATLPGTSRHNAVLSYLAGPVFHPLSHRDFKTVRSSAGGGCQGE
jgi:hypothetical protein